MIKLRTIVWSFKIKDDSRVVLQHPIMGSGWELHLYPGFQIPGIWLITGREAKEFQLGDTKLTFGGFIVDVSLNQTIAYGFESWIVFFSGGTKDSAITFLASTSSKPWITLSGADSTMPNDTRWPKGRKLNWNKPCRNSGHSWMCKYAFARSIFVKYRLSTRHLMKSLGSNVVVAHLRSRGLKISRNYHRYEASVHHFPLTQQSGSFKPTN